MNYYIGIDLSLTSTGVVVIENNSVYRAIEIKTKPGDIIPRVADIMAQIDSALDDLDGKKHLAIEGFSYGSKGKAVFQIAYLGYRVREHLKDYTDITPSQVKKYVTGKGNAKKDAVMLETYKRWGESFDSDNLADAYVLARIMRDHKLGEYQNKVQEDICNNLEEVS